MPILTDQSGAPSKKPSDTCARLPEMIHVSTEIVANPGALTSLRSGEVMACKAGTLFQFVYEIDGHLEVSTVIANADGCMRGPLAWRRHPDKSWRDVIRMAREPVLRDHKRQYGEILKALLRGTLYLLPAAVIIFAMTMLAPQFGPFGILLAFGTGLFAAIYGLMRHFRIGANRGEEGLPRWNYRGVAPASAVC